MKSLLTTTSVTSSLSNAIIYRIVLQLVLPPHPLLLPVLGNHPHEHQCKSQPWVHGCITSITAGDKLHHSGYTQ